MRPSLGMWKFTFMFILMLGYTVPNWKPNLSCEAWCKKFPNADGYQKYNVQRQKFACP
jgi:hypothetical protein